MKRSSAKKASKKRKKTSVASKGQMSGQPVAQVGREYALIRTTKSKKLALKPGDTARKLLTRTGKALAKPGISHRSVFRDDSRVFAYSAYASDPSKVVRKSADGIRTIGRVVDGKFKPR